MYLQCCLVPVIASLLGAVPAPECCSFEEPDCCQKAGPRGGPSAMFTCDRPAAENPPARREGSCDCPACRRGARVVDGPALAEQGCRLVHARDALASACADCCGEDCAKCCKGNCDSCCGVRAAAMLARNCSACCGEDCSKCCGGDCGSCCGARSADCPSGERSG
jgi:hypothetical protein